MVISPRTELSYRPISNGSQMQPSGDNATAHIKDDAILKAGWLSKRGGHTKAWKKRWFVLRKEGLAYYKDQSEYETRKVVRIENISGITSRPSGKRTAVCFYVGSRQVHVLAGTKEDAEDWVKALKEAVRIDQHQSSTPTSPIDIVNGASQTLRSPGNSVPSSSFISSFGIRPSTSMPFSDDDLSPALLSEDDFTSPISAVTSRHEDDDEAVPATLLAQRAERDKVIMQGYLKKHQSGALRGSPTVWAVLRPYGLYLYPDHNEYSPLKIIPFSEIVDASDLPTEAELSGSVQKSKKKPHFRFQVITKKKALRFSVDEEKPLDDWLGALKSCLEKQELLTTDASRPTTEPVSIPGNQTR